MLPDFDEEFASLSDYAELYRAIGLQVVPAVFPSRNAVNWKRPALQNWREYQNEMVSEEVFNGFFKGINMSRSNIGILTGNCSDRVFVVDLDLHKGGECALWWSCCLDMQDRAGELETPTQITGGGGLQLLFRAPENWKPPTIKTSIGVDIRGVGGFAVIAPSMHESGKRYRWEEGKEPWSIEIADAPAWFCEQIDILAEQHGGHTPSNQATKTSTPDYRQDGYGHLVDGREDYMAKMIWARVVDLYREAPFINDALSISERDNLFAVYVSKVDSRLPPSGLSKEDMLEREGRGKSAFNQKWAAAIRQWDDKVALHAREPRKETGHAAKSFEETVREGLKKNVPEDEEPEPEQTSGEKRPPADEEDFDRPANMLEILDINEIMALPDPVWLIDKFIIEDATAFLYGPPGCGKSFIALDIAFCLACDQITEWFGKAINRHGPVVYVTNEGVASLKFRLQALEGKYGIDHATIPFHLIRENLNFMDPKDILKVIEAIKYKVEKKIGMPPVAIFIDTVSRVIPGADENLQKDMTLFINAMGILKYTFKCMVMGVHHQSKEGGSQMRGSSTLTGAGDPNVQVEREPGSEVGTIYARKVKDAEDGWQIEFRLRKVVVGVGNTSLVVEREGGATTLPDDGKNASAGDFGGSQQTGVEPDRETCKRIVAFVAEERRLNVALTMDTKRKADGRYAPQVLARNFTVTEDWAKGMLNQWLLEGVLKVFYDRESRKTGLEIGKGLPY